MTSKSVLLPVVLVVAGLVACVPGSGSSSSSGSSGSGAEDAGSAGGDAGVVLCPNGVADEGEECDGVDLRGATCEERGYAYGTPTCTATCTLDMGPCVEDPCWEYACGPYGNEAGNVIPDMGFTPGNGAAVDLAGTDDVLNLHDLYRRNVAHGGPYKGVFLFVSTAWCPYCGEEAAQLEEAYQEFKDQGVLIVGVLQEDSRGNEADVADAQAYARRYHWTFPVVAGRLPSRYWPTTSDEAGGVPMHLFLDLTTMRIMGKIGGYAGMKLVRYAMAELAAGPTWGPNGERAVSFDCAPGAGTETEPNGMGEDYEDGSTPPFSLSGTLCPPVVAEDIFLDTDVVDLGNLQAGDLIQAVVTPGAGSPVYPFVAAYRLNAAGTGVAWYQYGTVRMAGSPLTRQLVVDTAGRYLLSVGDGRMQSHGYYGENGTVPDADGCCDGGAEFTYSLALSSEALAATEPALVLNASTPGTVTGSQVKVYPVDLVQGTSYRAGMQADSAAVLDPYIVVYDPASHQVLGANDDINGEGGDYNARVTFVPTATGTVWVVASYFVAYMRSGNPGYRVYVDQP
jgi:hypothetical protein